jgi:hypothetical protein
MNSLLNNLVLDRQLSRGDISAARLGNKLNTYTEEILVLSPINSFQDNPLCIDTAGYNLTKYKGGVKND